MLADPGPIAPALKPPHASDQADYQSEFSQLQSELTGISGATFNGIDLFGNSSMSIGLDADHKTQMTLSAVNLLTGASGFTDDFANLDNWSTSGSTGSGSVAVSGGALQLSTTDPLGVDVAEAQSNQTFAGAMTISMTVQGTSGMNFQVMVGDQLANEIDLADGNSHTLQMQLDANGDDFPSIDGVEQGETTGPEFTGSLYLSATGQGTVSVTNLQVQYGNTNTGDVATASSLSALSLSTITDALQDIAGARATNGAEQSRLNFAGQMLASNQTNLEAANSQITDVDVATETTNLAKWNVLVQAGTSMLTQANQSSQIALKLITG